jgi:hypothetical protein
MKKSALNQGFLVRGIAVAAILGCGLYFAFGVAALAASEQPGTAIHHYEPVSLGLLWAEVSKTSFGVVVRWFRQIEDIDGVVIMSTLTAWFSSALLLALLLAVVPRLFARSTALILAGLVLVPGILFGGLGLYSLFFTFVNAFFLRGLDGEWIVELGPVMDATGILYLITCLLFVRALSFRIRGPGEAATV